GTLMVLLPPSKTPRSKHRQPKCSSVITILVDGRFQQWWSYSQIFEESAPSEPRATIINSRSRSEEHTSELQSRGHLVCRLLLEVLTSYSISSLSLHDALPI